ncbi:MAG: hypothetical protein KTR31_34360 [Myxococcales bacterium]|nr:hypothetical protein [Myxococcales bacterium]
MVQRDPRAFTSEPTVRIERADGSEWVDLQTHLQFLELTDRQGGLATLELALDAVVRDPQNDRVTRPYDDDQIVRLGAPIVVGAADQRDRPHSMFSGRISAIETTWRDGEQSVVVCAEDALQSMRMKRRTKVVDDLKLKEFTEALAREHGITADVQDFTTSLGLQAQLNESDLAFLRRLVHDNDGELQVVEDVLQIRKVDKIRRGTVPLDAVRNRLVCRARADLAHQVTSVTLSGWDAEQGQRIASTSRFTATGPGRGKQGAEHLSTYLEGRPATREEHLAHVPVRSQTEADALVNAMHALRARQFVTIEVTAPGNPRLRVGAHVDLTGMGRRFDNTYQVVETCHHMDRDEGYQTTFTAQCAFLGEAP